MCVPPFYVSKYFSFYASFFFREHPVIRTHGAHLLAVMLHAFRHLNMAATLFLLFSWFLLSQCWFFFFP